MRFSEGVDWLGGSFELNPATDYATLADGKTVGLTNDLGECATIEVLADVRDIMPGGNLIAASNPFGLLVAGDSLYFPDAGYNSMAAVQPGDRKHQDHHAFSARAEHGAVRSTGQPGRAEQHPWLEPGPVRARDAVLGISVRSRRVECPPGRLDDRRAAAAHLRPDDGD